MKTAMRKTEEEILLQIFKENQVTDPRDFYIGAEKPNTLTSIIITAMQTFAQQDKWIKVEDGLPEDCKGLEEGEDVLVILAKYGRLDKNNYATVAYRKEGKWLNGMGRDIEDNPDYFVVTHWQPLPSPPNSTPST